MANIKSAKKRAIQNERRRKHNVALRSNCRTIVKKVVTAVKDKKAEMTEALWLDAVKTLDKAASKRLFHPNKVARCKSNLNGKIKKLKGI